MQQKNYGTSDIKVSPIIFGGNVLGWTLDEKQSFEILDYFFEKGSTPLILPIFIQTGFPETTVQKAKGFLENG